ncbi:dTDP-4-dehydrorhamnose 3,5-epimerase [bacterium]|nr:dTDP-4-dehydrorhamnose 3,5-epimerase [bacterium]
MKIINTKLPNVLILKPNVYEDDRGIFKEIFQINEYAKAGINYNFVQDNYSRSNKGVLRGLHFQKNKPQGKLVSCLFGAVYDVVVDVNPNSDTFGKYLGIELSSENHYQLWIPPGYAHGFCVLSDTADFYYKCTDYYNKEDEYGIIWNDKDLCIKWPTSKPSISIKDGMLPSLKSMKEIL